MACRGPDAPAAAGLDRGAPPPRPSGAGTADRRRGHAGAPRGTEEVLTDTLGEWTLATWLARRLPAERAEALAAGWDADRLRIVRLRADRDRWSMAWRVRCRTVAMRQALETELQQNLGTLVARLPGGGRRPELVWAGAGATLDVRVNWP